MHAIRLGLAFAKAGFKLQHEGSYLGLLWHFLNPLAAFIIIYLVFSQVFGQTIDQYPLYLLLGLIIFNFFRGVTSEATGILYGSRHIIKSINFPKESLIIASVLRSSYAHIFEVVVFVILMLFIGLPVTTILVYPVIFILLALFVYGLALGLSAFSVYFLDMSSIWGGFTQALWFATPIFYFVDQFSILSIFNLFNPLYYFISVSRDIIIYSTTPPLYMIGGVLGYTIVSLMLGHLIFNRVKNTFVEKM